MSEQQAEAKQKKTSSGSAGSITIALIAMIIALGAVGYGFYNDKNLKSQSQLEDTNISQLQNALSIAKQDLSTAQNLLSEQYDKLNKLEQTAGNKDRAWIIAEAEYLTRLANYTLHFQRNIPTAINLLETADAQVASLNDLSLTPVRQALATDIANLQSLPQLDLEGVLVKLTAISDNVDKLPVLGLQAPDTPLVRQEKQAHHHHHQSSWKKGLEKSMDALKNIVVVQRHDESVRPILTQAQRMMLNQHLQMLLSQAQWAAMHQKQSLYQQSLTDAQDLIRKNYIINSASTQGVIKQITELQTMNIAPTLPNLASTVHTMEQVLSQPLSSSSEGQQN